MSVRSGSIKSGLAAGAIAAALIPSVSDAQVLTLKDVSLRMALTIATTASEQCGAVTSIAVVDRNGQVKVLMQGDGGNPHNVELARRKAYTARTFRSASSDWAKRTETNQAQRMLTDVIALAGGVPIMVGKETIGGIGLSGAPGGGAKEEACGQAGIDKVADQLK